MISIGNDIVDLTAIDKNRTQQKAFYSKILSDTEQQLYSRSSQIPFEIYVWLLWSAKESVYKFAKRLDPELVFSPARIEISSEAELSPFKPGRSKTKFFQNFTLEGNKTTQSFDGFFYSENTCTDNKMIVLEANYQAKTYYLLSLICPQFIATVASEHFNFSKIHWGIKYIDETNYESQSATVRKFMLRRLNELFPQELDFKIDKDPVGYPIILKGQNETAIKASMAHHGHYVSYAFTN
jgi:phosphopantetheine--protein transferase-like protein